MLFQFFYGLEAILPIECDISSLKLVVELLLTTFVEEEHLLHLTRLDETRRDAAMANEVDKNCIKAQYDKNVKPRVFSEGYLVLLYDQDYDKLRLVKLQPMWLGPYIFNHVLVKGTMS